MIESGDVLAQKYRVERLLGKGGMGYVFAAFHEQLGRRVAVKFMTPQLCRNPEAVARFLREARSSARITGEHVARVIDVATHDDGTPYMVMEYLSGRDLALELEERRYFPVNEAVTYVLQACEALAEAHGYGIVHRDLKPSNLFLTRRADGSALVKVLDFGISKAIADSDGTDPNATESLTASQHLLGSPHYMSPEQVRTPRTIDARSDIWALGVILHELISGQRPFRGDTPMAILAAVVSDATPTLSSILPNLPRELKQVVQRCLEKEPSRRFPSVAALALALEPFAGPESRPLVGRIEGIVRATKSSSPSLKFDSLPPATPGEVPATLESARDSPYGLEARTAPQKAPPSSKPGAGSRAARLGVVAVVVAFGGLMYMVGALRPWAAPEQSSASAPSPTNSAALSSAAPPPAVTSLAAALPHEALQAAPKLEASAAPPTPEAAARRVVPLNRQLKATLPSATPSVTPPPAPPSDPFDQRR
ncbi:MAG: protein kinase [Polyangiaceae bacterium]